MRRSTEWLAVGADCGKSLLDIGIGEWYHESDSADGWNARRTPEMDER